MSALSEDVMWWLSSFFFFFYFYDFFFPQKKWGQEDCPSEPSLCQRTCRDFQHVEEDQKVSAELLPSGWSHRLFPHSAGSRQFLSRIQGWRQQPFTSAKEADEAREKKTNAEKHRAPIKCQLFCLWPSKRLRFVWKWTSRLTALGSMGVVGRNVYFRVRFAEVAWWGPRS